MVLSKGRCLALLCVFVPDMPHLHTAIILFVFMSLKGKGVGLKSGWGRRCCRPLEVGAL